MKLHDNRNGFISPSISDIQCEFNQIFGQKSQPPLHDDDTPARSKLWMRSAVYVLRTVY